MRNKGIAIVLALATVLVVSGIGTLIFTRTIREIRHGAQDQGIVQTLMLARGAANLGGSSSPPGAGKGWKGSCSKPRAPRTGGPTAATPGPRRRTLFSWPKRWRTWRTDSSPTLTASFAERTSPRTAYPPRCGSGSTSLRAPAANPFPQRPTSPGALRGGGAPDRDGKRGQPDLRPSLRHGGRGLPGPGPPQHRAPGRVPLHHRTLQLRPVRPVHQRARPSQRDRGLVYRPHPL